MWIFTEGSIEVAVGSIIVDLLRATRMPHWVVKREGLRVVRGREREEYL